tara:strand:- start:2845 stop:3057 length:213 start_codon:yes stop_codon:yes gene_type:complete
MADKFRRTPYTGMIITEPKRRKEPKALLKLQKEKELRKLMNTMNTMGGQPIRGMNSERRKDLLKPSKFRR